MTATDDKQLTFDEESHTYRIGGQVVPSVTSVIGRVMPVWQADEFYLQRGRALHHGCVLSDRGTLDWNSVSPEIEGRILAWRNFRQQWPAGIIEMEMPLGSTAYRFAGTFDRLFEFDGEYILCDIKSTVEPQVEIQLGGYSLLWKERVGILGRNRREWVARAVAVQVNPDETYRATWFDGAALRRAESAFIACLTIHNFMESRNLRGNNGYGNR